jgi:hypothetical protein
MEIFDDKKIITGDNAKNTLSKLLDNEACRIIARSRDIVS